MLVEPEDNAWDQLIERVQAAMIGELHFIYQLGRGGMAAVYLAEEIRLGRKVAVKLILPELMADERMVRRFKDEARTVANLRHANIVRLYSVREAAGIHFFSMDYIEGRPLDDILDKSGALPVAVVLAVLFQIAGALSYAHRQGVFHRDIKPANILIDTDGNAYVTDFGIAKVRNAAIKGETLTQLGTVVGTPSYMSPEQCLSRPITAASDQYSLGVVAYEMLAGGTPFSGESSFELMSAHTHDPLPPLSSRRSGCPSELETAVHRMLAKRPEDRFSTMAEALTALGAQPLPDDNPQRLAFAALAVPRVRTPRIHTPPPRHNPPSARVDSTQKVPSVAMIGISPPPEDIEIGEQLELSASVRDSSSNTLAGVSVTWRSSDIAVASVDPTSGTVLGVGEGSVEISASAGRARASVLLSVVSRRVHSVSIERPDGPVLVGTKLTLIAEGRDKGGQSFPGRPVLWRSASPSIATVAADGTLQAVAVGDVMVTATVDGVSAQLLVSVTIPAVATIQLAGPRDSIMVGDCFPMSLRLFDRRGVELTGRDVTYTVNNATVARVRAEGDLEALAAGSVIVTAHSEGRSATATVKIEAIRVERLQLSTPPGTVIEGEAFTLTAQLFDARDRPMDGGCKWQSSDAAILAVSSAGVVTALRAGSARITCTSGGRADTVNVSVKAIPVAVVRLSSPPDKVVEGDRFRLVATAFDEHGAHLAGREVSWRSDNSAMASVAGTGVVTTLGPGTVRISAVCEATEAFVVVEVLSAPIASISVTGMSPSTLVGSEQRAVAVVMDALGRRVTRPVNWRSDNPALAAVDAHGNVTAVKVGRVRVTAEAEGIECAVEMTIVAAAAPAIEHEVAAPIRPAPVVAAASPVTAAPGLTIASPRTPQGAPSGRRLAIFAGVLAAVGAAGVGVFLARGPARPGHEGGKDSVAVTSTGIVTPPTRPATGTSGDGQLDPSVPAALVLSPKAASVPIGDSIALSATWSGAAKAGSAPRTIAWRSTNAQVAAVTARGIVRGLSVGKTIVIATSAERAETASVTVTSIKVRVSKVQITPPLVTMLPGASLRLAPQVEDEHGASLSGRPLQWKSSDARVVKVDMATGVLSALTVGVATISASSEGITGVSVVTVAAAPPTIAQTATPIAGPPSPPSVTPGPSSAQPRSLTSARLAAGGNMSCGVAPDGTVSCWGLGQNLPTPIAGVHGLSRLSVGRARACGIAGGIIHCWDGMGAASAVHADTRFTDVSVGGAHVCAVDATGKLYCWGSNDNAQLGTGNNRASVTPVAVRGEVLFTAVSAGKTHTCAIATDGRAYCWGDGFVGQLGNGMQQNATEPYPVESDVRFRRIAAGDEFTCGLSTEGKAYCWGDNSRGQLGDNRSNRRTKPTEVSRIPTFVSLSLGDHHACGLTDEGKIFCWGDNSRGQLGNGSTASRPVPGEVESDGSFTAVSAGMYHTCGIAKSQATFCWGDNAKGQVGDASNAPQPSPQPVHQTQ